MDKQTLTQKIKNLDGLTDQERADLLALLNQKRYGLVWEDKPEAIEERLAAELPILIEVPERAIIAPDCTDDVHIVQKNNPAQKPEMPSLFSDIAPTQTPEKYTNSKCSVPNDSPAPNHILIEGDNLEALTTLAYTHAGKIDVIYIDPPYNTGAKNWKYNNDYVDKEDSFRHSKFVSFLNHRLKIAKQLLSEDGIIICAIDDYEIHNTRLLFDEIFGEDNRLGTIVVVHNPRGRNDDTFIATMHEYLLVYAKNSGQANIGYFSISEEDAKKEFNKSDEISAYAETSYIRTGNNSLKTERPGLWYEIYYNPDKNTLSLEYKNLNDILLLPKNGKNEERCWRWSPETFEKKKDTELFVKKVKGEYKIYKKRRITEIEGRKPKTVWFDSKYDASSNGIMLLQNIFDGVNPFPYPKSIYAVLDCLIIASKKSSTILDFFAGSGTTLHATMQLNAEDGGNRRCILVTNNENGICENVTYERNRRVIQGYTNAKGEQVAGLTHNNLRYYRTGFVPRNRTAKNMRQLVALATDMLCIKEDNYNEQTEFCGTKTAKNTFRYFCTDDVHIVPNRLLIIYDESEIENIVQLIENDQTAGKINIYVFSPNDDPWRAEFAHVAHKVQLCALPQAIYNAYKNILPKS